MLARLGSRSPWLGRSHARHRPGRRSSATHQARTRRGTVRGRSAPRRELRGLGLVLPGVGHRCETHASRLFERFAVEDTLVAFTEITQRIAAVHKLLQSLHVVDSRRRGTVAASASPRAVARRRTVSRSSRSVCEPGTAITTNARSHLVHRARIRAASRRAATMSRLCGGSRRHRGSTSSARSQREYRTDHTALELESSGICAHQARPR